MCILLAFSACADVGIGCDSHPHWQCAVNVTLDFFIYFSHPHTVQCAVNVTWLIGQTFLSQHGEDD